MNHYKELIKNLSLAISNDIVDLNIARKRGTAPTQAFSDFLTHSEQGDWAENLLHSSIERYFTHDLIPVKYGKSDKIIAGDPGFKKFYLSYQNELDTIGKRPDILLYDPQTYVSQWGKDISQLPIADLGIIVPKSLAGLEVRSSAYLTKKFSPKDDRPFLSFTPKVEDLIVVLKWIETYGVPHFYVQVFFDGIYVIPFTKILEILGASTITTKGIKNKKIYGTFNGLPAFAIEKNPKNQYKETIHIYLNQGVLISEKIALPGLEGKAKELEGGRLLHYVRFNGGQAEIKTNFIELIRSAYE